MVVTVDANNDGPTANAGADQNVTEDDTPTLDATSSTDPDSDDTLSYAWSVQSGPCTVDNATAASTTVTIENRSANFGCVIQVTTTDQGTNESQDEMTLTVAADNDTPEYAGSLTIADFDEDTDSEDVADLDDYFSDPDVDHSCTYSVVTQPANATVTIDNENLFTISPDQDYFGEDSVQFRCTDEGDSSIDSEEVGFTVTGVNDPPVADAGDNIQVHEDDGSVQLDATGSQDPDGDVALVPLWIEYIDSAGGCSIDNPTILQPTVTFEDTTSTYSCVYWVTVTDGVFTSQTAQVAITITGVNDKPNWTTVSEKIIDETESVTFSVAASDDDSSSLTLSAEDYNDTFATIEMDPADNFTDNEDGSGTFSWLTDYTDEGDYQVAFDAQDEESTQRQIVNISVEHTNAPPTFTGSMPTVAFIAGQPTVPVFNVYDYFADIDQGDLSFSVTGNLNVIVNIAENGDVTFNSGASFSGSESIKIIATDGIASAESNVIVVTVTEAEEDGDGGGDSWDRDEVLGDISHVEGRTGGPGVIEIIGRDGSVKNSWQAFNKGGVTVRLGVVQSNVYVFAMKRKPGTTMHVYEDDTDGEPLRIKKISKKVHWRKVAVGNLDNKIKTEEIVTVTKRGSKRLKGKTLYFKLFSYKPAKNRFVLRKRVRLKNGLIHAKRFRVSIKNKKVIIKNKKGKVLLRWKPFK